MIKQSGHNRKKADKILSDPDKNSPVGDYVKAFKAAPRLGRHVVFHHVTGPKMPVTMQPAIPLMPEIRGFLSRTGIKALYSHQATAIDAARQGRHIVVATSTASGKTLIYNIPVLERILQAPVSRALYLFPLKALANDQLATFRQMAEAAAPGREISCSIYDGDTTRWQRRKIRNAPPACLFTNPDMLHLSILPYHTAWGSFFQHLNFVIVDEVHTYRGLFGSHMAWVFRRLRRICRRHGSDPVFIFCSATVSNPAEIASELSGLDVEPITRSGAPCGKRHFLMVDPAEHGAPQMAVQLLTAALHRGLRTIVYTQSRKLTELINLWTVQRARRFANRISAYRSGFLPEERREIEARMSDGSLLAVISTSALELGIDIGALDLCILVGYPGTVMSTWQRGGRVGRSMRESAVILVAQEDALDRYFLQHPAELMTRKAEAAVINPLNSTIMDRHLICAASELPIKRNEELATLPSVQNALYALEDRGRLLASADGSELFSSRRYPHREVNLRGTGKSFQIISSETGEIIGSVDSFRAMRETHPGAIYMHRGETFLVKNLDLETRHAVVTPAKVNYFTRVTACKDTKILEISRRKSVGNAEFFLGRLKVTDQVTGFERRLVRGQRLAGKVELDLPPHIFETEGFWFTLPRSIVSTVEKKQMHLMGGIHALEHAIIGILPLFILTDRNDLGGISFVIHPQCSTAAVFVYDGVPGGIGLSRQAFRQAGEIMKRAIAVISGCKCENGCPSCVHSPKCGSGNRPIDKEAALFIARAMLEKTVRTHNAADTQAMGAHSHHNDGQKARATCQLSSKKPDDVSGAPRLRNRQSGPKAIHLPPRLVVFDVETQRSAAETGGWKNAHLMKVSCAVLYACEDGMFHTFFEHQLNDFFEILKKADLVAGFNIKRFDYRVLEPYTDLDLYRLPTFDLLEKIHQRLGYRLSLNSLAATTLNARKSADGLQALKWWKQGKLDLIAEYCRKDVEITRDLLFFAARHGYLLFKNKAGNVVRLPVNM